jgi:hypothetical protein
VSAWVTNLSSGAGRALTKTGRHRVCLLVQFEKEHAMAGSSVKDKDKYRALKRKGMSKTRAAKIANAGKSASRKGGKKGGKKSGKKSGGRKSS